MNRIDVLDRLLTPRAVGDDVAAARVAVEASQARLEESRQALASRFGQQVLNELIRGAFAEVLVSQGGGVETPLTRDEFLSWVAREPRAVSSPGMGGLAELEIRDEHSKLPGSAFGNRLEPDAELYTIHTGLIVSALEGQIAVGARHLDRSVPRLGDLCEDLVAVAGTDTFTKLFVAGGELSRTGWHRDPQDVFVTMGWGRKRFQVAAASVVGEDPGPDDIEVDIELAVGDCLLLPEGRLHRAIPDGAESGLMSVALLRRANWIERGQTPQHLGVDEHPPTEKLYGELLRPRRAEYHELLPGVHYRVASPGGIHVVAALEDGLVVLVGGLLFRADEHEITDLSMLLTDGAALGDSQRLDGVISMMNLHGLLRRRGW